MDKQLTEKSLEKPIEKQFTNQPLAGEPLLKQSLAEQPLAEQSLAEQPLASQTTSQPLVSVVMIFFNAKKENFFEEAIESIFAQTYDNWELLLADDGSTDESSAIAQRYAQQHPQKVRYLEHKGHQNRGMSATRNLGIRHAQGQYVAFLDSDDIWLPHKLTEQIALMEAHPQAAMIYGKTQFWFSWSEHNPVPQFQANNNQIDSKTGHSSDPLTITSVDFDRLIEPPTQLLLYLQNRNIYPCSCSMVMRREIFAQLGGFEEAFRNANEDMVFHSKVFLNFPVYVSSQCWDKYRIHPDSYWRTVWRQGKGEAAELTGRLNYLKWLETYLANQPNQYPLVKRALKTALRPYQNPKLHRLIGYSQHPLQSAKNLLTKIGQKLTSPAG